MIDLITDSKSKLMYLDERLTQASPGARIKKLSLDYKKYTYDLDRNFKLILNKKKTGLMYLKNQVEGFNFKYLIDSKKEAIYVFGLKLDDLKTRIIERKYDLFF